jgi:DNA replication protein DnaC
MNTMEIALSYLNKGFSVMPVWSPAMLKKRQPTTFRKRLAEAKAKNSASDNPLPEQDIVRKEIIKQCKEPVLAWKEFQVRLPTVDEVTQWFTDDPDANIGIITGKVSNLVVFDLDSEGATRYAEDEGGFPLTVMAKTGRGYHAYMRHPGFDIKNSVNKKLDLDIRSDGGYVVAPPSLHGAGFSYQWVQGQSIYELDPAECTPWMIDYLKGIASSHEERKAPVVKELQRKPLPLSKKASEKTEYSQLLSDGCSEGERNQKTTQLVGHLFKTGLHEGELWEFLKMWNQSKVRPALGEDELRRIYDSVRAMELKGKKKIPDINSFLDTRESIIAGYKSKYQRISFAGDNLGRLEEVMGGGLAGGRLYILGGIPSSGKTALVNNLADNICLKGHPVLFFSYDDGKEELRNRSLARFTDHSIELLNASSVEDIGKLLDKEPMMQILKLKYTPESMVPVNDWNLLIEQFIKLYGQPPVIFVDYLRKLRTDSKITDERLRVDDILTNLTDLAKAYNTPIFAISELARDSYKTGQRLSMASFKESGTIEYEASWLGILAAVEELNGEYHLKDNWENIVNHDGNIDLIVFKAKRGTGTTGRVTLKLNRSSMTVSCREVKNNTVTTVLRNKSKYGRGSKQ